MGIFTRFRDIVSSNINAMLDRAEDPEKLIRLMIQEMEDTLVELKAGCAGVMANSKKVQRQLEDVQSRAKHWEQRAQLAVRKGRDDLAKEALVEKRLFADRADSLQQELLEHNALVEQYQADIRQLEDKLTNAREKQRMLIQRHIRARKSMRARQEIRRANSAEAVLRFDELENRIERMEAEAELAGYGQKPILEAEFDKLLVDEDIEKELQKLKSSAKKENDGTIAT
ncbi:MAG: phage shock protein PspA [Deltaproteobacteria bacterium]|nr:phage shock protein PspA [Deltaproteobacteria bacterium]